MWEGSHHPQHQGHSSLLNSIDHLKFGKISSKRCCGRFACVSKYSWYHIVSYSFEDAWQSEPQNRKGKHLLSSSCTTPVLDPPLFDEEEAAHVDDEPVKAVPEPDSVDALC